jgi:hypothetical protein
MKAAPASFSPGDRRDSWLDAPTSTRRFEGFARTRSWRRLPLRSKDRHRRAGSAIVAAVSPQPVNLLINAPFITVRDAANLGVRRISVGGTLARTAWRGFLQAAHEVAEAGTFSGFEQLPDVEELFSHQ